MGKYYYVRFVNASSYNNSDLGIHGNTETWKEMQNIATYVSLGYSEPSALALKGVQRVLKQKRVKGFLGIEYTNEYYELDPFKMICEKNGDYFEEVITGERYEAVAGNYYNGNVYSKRLILAPVRELSSNEVVEILKSLSSDDLARFKVGMAQLNAAVENGYYRDMMRNRQNDNQQQSNEDYIKNFRNRYGR